LPALADCPVLTFGGRRQHVETRANIGQAILDDTARQRRLRKMLEKLEEDNSIAEPFPSAAEGPPVLFQEVESEGAGERRHVLTYIYSYQWTERGAWGMVLTCR